MTEHRLTIVGLVVGILGAAAGVYFPLQSQMDSQRQKEAQRVTERQRTMDAIYQRLGNDEAAIAALASQLPQDKRDILNAIRAAQQQAQAQPQPVMYDKSLMNETTRFPVLTRSTTTAMPAVNQMPKYDMPAADAPASKPVPQQEPPQ